MRCCVVNCPNARKRLDVPSFGIPHSDVRDRWIQILKIDPQTITRNTRVCIRHFNEDDLFYFSTRITLKPKRVPSQNLGNEPEILQENLQIQDINITIPDITSPSSSRKKLRGVRKNPVNPIRRKHFTPINSQFYVENFIYNDDEIFFYTGVQSYKMLTIIYRFIFKTEKEPVRGDVHQTGKRLRKKHKLTPLNEMFLTLIKLRRNFEYKHLARMFLISKSAVARIVITWVNLLYNKLGDMDIFPDRDIIFSTAPPGFIEKYPNVIGSIDCTEFYIQKPSSLVRQSQCYSNYKSSNTLKALIMVNPMGSIMFVSTLYTGSISDKQLVKDSGLLRLLKAKRDNNEINEGDIILADKGFEIRDLLKDIGVEVNIPTFKINGLQFQDEDVQYTRKIAHERIHVERAIRRLKTFKILSNTIPISLLSCINQIYTVCALLTNFMTPLRN